MQSLVAKSKVKMAASALLLVFLVHVTVFYASAAIFNRETEVSAHRSRLRPRHVFETEVRSATYHVHGSRIKDRVVRDTYTRWRRNVEAVMPRFVARRALSDNGSEEPEMNDRKFYKLIGQEVGNLKLRCGSCAVVGSAGTLAAGKSGSSVDSADCVFRLGLAPVHGFEEDVGSKTTVRVVDGKSFSELSRRPSKLVEGSLSAPTWIVFDPDLHVDTLRLTLKMRALRKVNSELSIYTLTRRGENQALVGMKQAAAKLGYKLPNSYPSTLWFTIQAAQESGCSNLTVMGIPDPKFCKRDEPKTPARYWGKASQAPLCSSGKDSGWSEPTAELQLISLGDRRALGGLARTRHIQFRAPSWPVQPETEL